MRRLIDLNRYGVLLLLFLCAAGFLKAMPVQVFLDTAVPARYPTDIAPDGENGIWLVDGLAKRLLHLDAAGREIGELSHPLFGRPMGLDIQGARLIVADAEPPALHLFRGLAYQKSVQLAEGMDPLDVLFHPQGYLVSDNDNHRLLLLDTDGTLLKVFGRKGKEQQVGMPVSQFTGHRGEPGEAIGEFIYPGLLGRAGEGFVVADVLGSRVQGFSPLGNFDRMIGSFGTGLETLYRPKAACACVVEGGVLVTDSYTGLIHVYNQYNEHQGVMTLDDKPWVVETPSAIAKSGERWWLLLNRPGRLLSFGVAK